MKEYYTDLIDGCLVNQLPNGFFYGKITKLNFEESTLAAMLAFSIYTGIKAGGLNSSDKVSAGKMRKGVCSKIDDCG